ncbi:ABC transporter substrate-binding protein [Nisaea nitritireducens]|uniref:ABC transporter substrate-binding protein n=1 Tax=Nisaea nitritireducens TaxID=568392 RepID=UPI001866EC7D|nr:ABC transporter substrate-binding protein [Nisaea nitritireducens]
MMTWIRIGLSLIVATVSLREVHADELGLLPDAPIKVGMAITDIAHEQNILNGAKLAIEQINAKGGVLGHPLAVIVEYPPELDGKPAIYERLVADRGREQAKKLATQRPVVVIGHTQSSAAIAASTVYQNEGILFLSTNDSDDSLTQHSFSTVFRMNLTAKGINEGLAHHASKMGLCQVIQIWPVTTYGMETALRFSQMAGSHDIEIVLSASYPENTGNFKDFLVYLLDNPIFDFDDIDAIHLVANAGDGGEFIQIARQLGITAPIFGNNALSQRRTKSLAGDAFYNITTYSMFDPSANSEQWDQFVREFEARFGSQPNEQAALAYDAVNVVVAAIEQNKSLVAAKISSTLHALPFTGAYQGVTGPIAFDLKGDLKDRAFNFITYLPDGKLYIEHHDPSRIMRDTHDMSNVGCSREANSSGYQDERGMEKPVENSHSN